MMLKLALSAGLLFAAGVGTTYAQTTTTDAPAVSAGRNPSLGDPGSRVTPRRRHVRQPIPSDKPGPGQTNGNPPDRAAAGGGGR